MTRKPKSKRQRRRVRMKLNAAEYSKYLRWREEDAALRRLGGERV